LAGVRFFSLCYCIQTRSGAPSYPVNAGGLTGYGLKLTTHLHLVPRLKMDLYLHSQCFHGVVLS